MCSSIVETVVGGWACVKWMDGLGGREGERERERELFPFLIALTLRPK